MYLRDTTLTSPFPILLFGGDIDVQHRERLVSVDGWINFQVFLYSPSNCTFSRVCVVAQRGHYLTDKHLIRKRNHLPYDQEMPVLSMFMSTKKLLVSEW